MKSLPALTLDARKRLTTRPVTPDGPVIRILPVKQARVADIPLEYLDILKSARVSGTEISLVTCRRAGVAEARDNSHLQHFLVPEDAGVLSVGVTF